MGDKKRFMQGLISPEEQLTLLKYKILVDDRYRKSMVNNYSSQSERNELIHGIKKMDDGTKCKLESNTV
jgi:hypothetical protein